VGRKYCANAALGSILGTEDQALTQRLRTHVDQLAGEVGERNVFRPQALHAAASYIKHQWDEQGYAVEQLPYDMRPQGFGA